MFTLSSLYQSTLFTIGIVLIVLGIGNTVVAQAKVRQYQTDLARTPPSIDAEQTFGKNARLHHFSSEAWSRWALAQAKLDFYQVLLSSGWLLLSAGTLCTVIAIRRTRYPRTRLARPSIVSRGTPGTACFLPYYTRVWRRKIWT